MKDSAIIKFLWHHIKPYKWYYLVMVAAPIISSFYPFAYNYAIKLIIDAMADTTVNFDYKNILYPIILFMSAQLILDVTWRISEVAEWRSEPYVRSSILLQGYDYIQNHSYAFFQDNFTGAISSKLKGALDGYDKFWNEMHGGLLFKLFRIFVNLSVLMFVNIHLGLFIIAWIVIYVPWMFKLSTKQNILSFDVSECRHSIIGQISDKIMNIFSIKSYANNKNEYNALETEIKKDYIPKQIRSYIWSFKLNLISSILYFVFFAFMIIFMVHLKIQNLISIGDFALVFGLALITTDDLWQSVTSMQDFSMAMGDLKSSLTHLHAPQNNLDVLNAKQLTVDSVNIEFKNIYFGYHADNIIFKGLSLKIKSGEKIGLVGHSGSGKSTLINLLLRYFSCTDGSINISQQDIANVTQESLRKNIAVIPQDIMLFHRSLMENIRFGDPAATDEQVIAASKKAHIHEYIMTLPNQYNTFVGERGVKLSGGQRQRVAIARAILKNAPILILDEATSSLDSQTEKLIQESLNVLIDDRNKTVIAIAHRLSTLKHMDRIIVLDNGKIIEEGTHDELLAKNNSLYKKLWQYQEI